MSDWTTSTHKSRWIFTKEQLAATRARVNSRALEALVTRGCSRVDPLVNLPLVSPTDGDVVAAAAAASQLGRDRGEDGKPAATADTRQGPGNTATSSLSADGGVSSHVGGGTAGGSAGEGEGEEQRAERRGKKRGRDEEARPEGLSVEEEAELRRFYEGKIQEVCAAFRFPHKIYATSLHYFKRFYLRWSVMEHDPKSIMLTVIYVACKVDEAYVSAEAFANGINSDPRILLDHELAVLQALQFDLICFGPYRSIHGYLLEYASSHQEDHHINGQQENGVTAANVSSHSNHSAEEPSIQLPRHLEPLLQASVAAVSPIFLTDVPLLFPPGAVALAAMKMGNVAAKALPDFDKFLDSVAVKAGHGPSQHTADTLRSYLSEIQREVAASGRLPAETALKGIDRKLKMCTNPAYFQEELRKRKERKERARAKRTSHAVPIMSTNIEASPLV